MFVRPADGIIVRARRLDERADPLAAYAVADPGDYRSCWMRTASGFGLVGCGVVAAIEPSGPNRFSAASAELAVLADRVHFKGPDDAPLPLLTGGFSFTAAGAAGPLGRQPAWAGFDDCRLVLAELTVIDRDDGTWILAARRTGTEESEEAVEIELEERIESFAARLSRSDAPRSPGTVLPGAGLRGGRARRGSRARSRGDGYLTLAAVGIEAIRRRELQKVVLAHAVALNVSVGNSARTAFVLDRLRSGNPDYAVFAFSAGGGAVFFGATPEPLAVLEGSRLRTAALGGTAARGDTPAEDQALGNSLLASEKNLSEHRFVVEGITESLTELGLEDLEVGEPGLLQQARVQQLRTPISGRTRPGCKGMSSMDVIRVAGKLHPTPAVGGMPTAAALAFIAEHEGLDRGWYAAPVGWCDLGGSGEMWVALRSGLAEPEQTWLFAGAGIVSDSVPIDELRETADKLRTLHDAIGDLVPGSEGRGILSSLALGF